MIKAINSAKINTNFRSEQPENKKKAEDETRILPNTLQTRLEQGFQKTTSAFIDYPIKGLKGDINSNFYEFLTMGTIPYLLGSAMFMFIFNALNSKGILGARDKKAASQVGKKMALGVLLYGVMKSLTKTLVTKPIKAATGVDTEMPYQNKVYNLPKGAGENAVIDVQWQQRKVFDSKEFYRKDLLKKEYFDEVGKKLGLGNNLNDSVTEVSPIIQNIVATSNTAKNLSSYCWAATGVGLAMQDSWLDFFESFSKRKHYTPAKNEGLLSRTWGKTKTFVTNAWNITKQFGKSTLKSFKELWKGNPAHSGFRRHAGKALLSISTAVTIGLTANTIIRAKNLAKNKNIRTIDKTKESTVI